MSWFKNGESYNILGKIFQIFWMTLWPLMSLYQLPHFGMSLNMCTLPTKTCEKVFSMLQTTTSPKEWWLQTTTNGTVISSTGVTSFGPILTCSFKICHTSNKSQSSKPSLTRSSSPSWHSSGCTFSHWKDIQTGWPHQPSLLTQQQ